MGFKKAPSADTGIVFGRISRPTLAFYTPVYSATSQPHGFSAYGEKMNRNFPHNLFCFFISQAYSNIWPNCSRNALFGEHPVGQRTSSLPISLSPSLSLLIYFRPSSLLPPCFGIHLAKRVCSAEAEGRGRVNGVGQTGGAERKSCCLHPEEECHILIPFVLGAAAAEKILYLPCTQARSG